MATTLTPHSEHLTIGGESTQALPAMRMVRSNKTARVLAWILVVLFIVTALALTITPWQQNIQGTGRVIAFAPVERQQSIDAPVDGRVMRWYVTEGQAVRRGDPIVDITDNDPSIMTRLGQERDATRANIDAELRRVKSLEDRLKGLDDTRTTSVAAAKSRVQAAIDRVRASEQAVQAAEAALLTARLNIERTKKLATKGLNSTRTLELAELELNTRVAEVDRSKATLNGARNDQFALESELQRTDAEARARIDEAWAAHASAGSAVAKAQADLTKIEVRFSRQATQSIVAPIDGTIFRVVGRQQTEFIKAGESLATLVPQSSNYVVELNVSGNDVPLIQKGRKVRLQFEGWPALQFAGWPSVAVGTFGGQVLLVDPTDNGKGKFRVLVSPDPSEEPWPSRNILRQGARAEGWVLLNIVPLGWELWRQFNGFQPVVDSPEINEKLKAKPGAKSSVSSYKDDDKEKE